MSKIKPADRLSHINEYYFSEKLKEINRLNQEGADIVSLGIGGPDLPPHQNVIETLVREAGNPDNHSYQSYNGLPELRKAYSDWYFNKFNVVINHETEILPLIGSKEGILHISMAFLNPNDGVLIPDPGYPTYSSVSKLTGAKIFYYDLKEENNWIPDFEELKKLPLQDIKLMWVNYPHMPTGKEASLDLFSKLIEFGRENDIVIVNDNPYSFILNKTPLSILQIEGAKEIAIELNSLSKSHNMAGWRMAMTASNSEFIKWILKVKSNVDSGQFKPMMLAAAKALCLDQNWYDLLFDTYAERRRIAEEILITLNCRFDPDQKGLFLWGRIPDKFSSGKELADELLYEAHVFVTPGFIFGKNGEKYIRISLCAKPDKLKEALNRIKKYERSVTPIR